MNRLTSAIRRPVRRQGASQYLLFTLLSFATSVTLTRLFLELTGYPQLGNSQLHIAHVLWGGLLLFIASLLPLVVANRWVYTVGGILSGTGVGLFIDEVGKFITQNNDYFFPLAAPIIYAFFLLTVLLYLRVRRPPSSDPRAELYRAFDSMEEVLEHDLDEEERQDLRNTLLVLAERTEQKDLRRLARDLLDFLDCEDLVVAPARPRYWERIAERWKPIERRWVTPLRIQALITGGLLALALISLTRMALTLPFGAGMHSLQSFLTVLVTEGQIRSSRELNFYLVRVASESLASLLLLASAGLMIARKVRLGLQLGNLGLLLSLTMVNLVVFYFDQFSTIVTAIFQFLLLLVIAYFRQYQQRQIVQPVILPGTITDFHPAASQAPVPVSETTPVDDKGS